VGFNALGKLPCPKVEIELSSGAPTGPAFQGEIKVEVLAGDGSWVESPSPPMRDNVTGVYTISTFPADGTGGTRTVRISWEDGFTADVITSYVPSGEAPAVRAWQVGTHNLMAGRPGGEAWSGFEGGEILEMVRGDILEFGFEVTEPLTEGHSRDYIVVATGRYQPDYTVYDHLVPGAYCLHDTRPNPFQRATTIAFDLPAATHVRLYVFNVLGQHVATLVDETREAGAHEIEWTVEEGSTLASGVYFYQLTTDDYTSRKKVFLLR
jgi:hypothetical protein